MKAEQKANPTPSLKVPFAYTESGVLIEPTAAEEGAVFKCPGCSGEVRRRRSSRGRLHFYHRDPRDERESCGETALHLAAKAVLEKIESLQLPELRLPIPSPSGGPIRVYPGGSFKIDKAELEVSLENGERVVDVILSGNASPPLGPTIYIEVCVTNPVVGERKAWFRKWNVPALEISVCHLKHPELNALRTALNQPANQRWIHHPDYAPFLASAKEKLRLADEEHKKAVAAHRAREEAKRRQKQEALERQQRLQARVYEEFKVKFLPDSEAENREARWAEQLAAIEAERFPIAVAIASTHVDTLQPHSRWIIKQRASAKSPAVWLGPCLKELAANAPYSVADPPTVCDLARRAEINDCDAFHLLSLEINVADINQQLAHLGKRIAVEAEQRRRTEKTERIEKLNEFYEQSKRSAAAINAQNRMREKALKKSGKPAPMLERWIPCPTCFDKKSVRWHPGELQPGEVTCNCTNTLPVPANIVEKDV